MSGSNGVPRRTKLLGASRVLGGLVFALCLAVLGLYLALAGGYLSWLGGSVYYVLAGLTLIASAVLILRRRWLLAGQIYGALFLLTLLWSFWEVGLEGWALVPRLGVLAGLGLPFALSGHRFSREAVRFGLPLLVILVGVVILLANRPGRASKEAAGSPLALADPTDGEWRDFSNGNNGNRFSPLQQITAENVSGLKVAWSREFEMPAEPVGNRFEAVPLKVRDKLYLCTSTNDVYAVDAETGQTRWQFKSGVTGKGLVYAICRGVTYYRVPGAQGECAERIYTNSVDARLIALDARTGRRCAGFGTNGQVDLLNHLGQKMVGYFFPTSAPLLFKGKLLVNGGIADGQYVGEPSGVVRAYDAITGQLTWAWDLGRLGYNKQPPPGQTYTLGTPNSWAPASFDAQLNTVYFATGNATPDYVYGHRSPASNRFGSSVIAVDADTGMLKWSFQTAHRDVWDYDVGSQPVLVNVTPPGAKVPVPALIQPTKRGQLFVLDRRTGRPVFPIVEKPTPQDGGVERMSPTQPYSTSFPDFGGPRLTERDMWGLSPADQLWCRIKFREARYDGPMTPPGLTPSIADTGYIGGMDWGSTAVDPSRNVAVVVSNRIVNYIQLITRKEADTRGLKPAGGKEADIGGAVPQTGTPYGAAIQAFLSPLGVPCQRPPYSMVGAVDLRTGKLLWNRPLGSARGLGPMGIPSGLPFTIGTPTIGGPMTTASGLTFVGGSQDATVRAFEVRTGRKVWEARLQFMSQTFPMTYYSEKSGRQFIAISNGDGRIVNGVRRASLVAFALPRNSSK